MKDNTRLWLFALFLGLILLHPMGLNKLMSQHSKIQIIKSQSPKEPSIQKSDISQATSNTVAYFAGVFWCMEPVFDIIDGVTDTTVGYMGGKKKPPITRLLVLDQPIIMKSSRSRTTRQWSVTRHCWRLLASIDPTDENGQFADQGPHYRTAIL